MPKIHITTFIAAPVERVFNLSRSITLHKISTKDTGEEAIAGVTSGLINLNERDTLFNDQDLKQFYERYKNRDLIIYDLTSNHFDHLVGLLKSYNEYGFNEIADIKECLIDYLTSNSFEYNSEKNIYKKSLKLETVELKDSIKKEKKSVKEHVTDVINIDLLNIVNMEQISF